MPSPSASESGTLMPPSAGMKPRKVVPSGGSPLTLNSNAMLPTEGYERGEVPTLLLKLPQVALGAEGVFLLAAGILLLRRPKEVWLPLAGYVAEAFIETLHRGGPCRTSSPARRCRNPACTSETQVRSS